MGGVLDYRAAFQSTLIDHPTALQTVRQMIDPNLYGDPRFVALVLKVSGLFSRHIFLRETQVIDHLGFARLLLEEEQVDRSPRVGEKSPVRGLTSYLREAGSDGIAPVVIAFEPHGGDRQQAVPIELVALWKMARSDLCRGDARPAQDPPSRPPMEWSILSASGDGAARNRALAEATRSTSRARTVELLGAATPLGADDYRRFLARASKIWQGSAAKRTRCVYPSDMPSAFARQLARVAEERRGMFPARSEARRQADWLRDWALVNTMATQTSARRFLRSKGVEHPAARGYGFINDAYVASFVCSFAAAAGHRMSVHDALGLGWLGAPDAPPSAKTRARPRAGAVDEVVRSLWEAGERDRGRRRARLLLDRMSFEDLAVLRAACHDTFTLIEQAWPRGTEAVRAAFQEHVNRLTDAGRARGLVDGGDPPLVAAGNLAQGGAAVAGLAGLFKMNPLISLGEWMLNTLVLVKDLFRTDARGPWRGALDCLTRDILAKLEEPHE